MNTTPYAESWGEGPPVLFVHGLGASGRYWYPLRETSGGYRATAVDLLGFGRSPKPRRAPYDVGFHVGILDRLVTPGSVVVAHSTGAILAAALASRRPGRVVALLLLGIPAYESPDVALRHIMRFGRLARWTVEARATAYALCALMCALRPLCAGVAPLLARDVPRAVAADGVRHTWPSYSRTLRRVVVEHPVLPDLLALASRPVVVLQGRDDITAPPHHVERLRAQGAHLDLRVVDGDHHLALRRPELVAETLRELLPR